MLAMKLPFGSIWRIIMDMTHFWINEEVDSPYESPSHPLQVSDARMSAAASVRREVQHEKKWSSHIR